MFLPIRCLVACCVTLVGPLVAQQFQFVSAGGRSPQPLATLAVAPLGLAIGDVDGDGAMDVVAAAGLDLEVALSGGAPHREFAVVRTQQPLLVDGDGDGDLDIVAGPNGRDGVVGGLEVWRHDGAALVRVPLPNEAIGELYSDFAVGDLDGDGDPDLVAATTFWSALPGVFVLRNDAMHQFTALPLAAPQLPPMASVVLRDFDGDGRLDIAAGGSGGMHLLRNLGGTFVEQVGALPAARGLASLVSGDFDGDGHRDLAGIAPALAIDVLWGGAAGFTYQADVALAPSAGWLDAEDFDGDGRSDLIVWTDRLRVLRAIAGRQFAAEVPLVAGPTACSLADVDRDGVLDVLYAADPPTQVLARSRGGLGAHDAAFDLLLELPAGLQEWRGTVAGDVDGDGRTDLVLVSTTAVVFQRSLGDGRYRAVASPATFATSGSPLRTRLADLDGDGRLDLVVADGQTLQVLRCGSTGAFTLAMSRVAASRGLDDLEVADLDGDGDLDILHGGDLGIVLHRNLGSAGIAAPVTLRQGASSSVSLATGDFDADGDLDIVTDLGISLGNMMLLVNDGSGQFSTRVGPSALNVPQVRAIVAADLDGDGLADVAVASFQMLRVFVTDLAAGFVQVGGDQVPSPGTILGMPEAGDLDGDGDADLAASAISPSGRPLMLVNDGAAQFQDVSARRIDIPSGNAGQGLHQVLQIADLDADGDADLVFSPSAGSGPTSGLMTNRLRHLSSQAPPRLGAFAAFDLFERPGFSAGSFGWLAFAPALLPAPVTVPGVAGTLQIDPAGLQVVDVVLISSIGASGSFPPVPPQPQLVGLEFFLQALLTPAGGGLELTNAVREVILR